MRDSDAGAKADAMKHQDETLRDQYDMTVDSSYSTPPRSEVNRLGFMIDSGTHNQPFKIVAGLWMRTFA